MAQNFEKSVKGATKVKLAAPKSKYIEHILVATHTGEAGVAEIFRTLHLRVRDSTWTIAFKALIVIHFMIREGQLDATLQYMAENPRKIAVHGLSEVQPQGRNIRRYSQYLLARANAFEQTKTDYVRSGQGRMKRLTVEKGLLRETEIVQMQIKELLRCDLLTDEIENEISLTAFRLLTLDLLTLYSVMNEGTINVLEHYFEMSRPDSERALEIYKTFTAQTEEVVKFLGVARQFESATRLEIPKLKHASTDLTRLLEDDLNDPDFNQRRREYLARKGKGGSSSAFATTSTTGDKPAPNTNPAPPRPKTEPSPQTKAAPSNLIDFFDSIEPAQPAQFQQQPQQQGMQFQQTGGFPGQQPAFYPQQTGFQQQPQPTGLNQQAPFGGPFAPQNTNQFGQQQVPAPLQATPTGAGFGGYTPQPQAQGFQSQLPPIPQNNVAAFPQQQQPPATLQPQTTNPFRQSMLMSTPTGSAVPPSPLNRQSTNPFAKRLSTANPSFPQAQPSQHSQQPAALQPQRTGTNPFARSSSVPPQQSQGLHPSAAPLRPTPTGSTNPFRQSTLVQQGQGWQTTNGQQGTMGGLEQLETISVFPRPGFS
ncbi:ANTH domain-containing protein [Aspergillus similis]